MCNEEASKHSLGQTASFQELVKQVCHLCAAVEGLIAWCADRAEQDSGQAALQGAERGRNSS